MTPAWFSFVQGTKESEALSYYLGIDIGASGGRHILGSFRNGIIVTEEVYRFDNILNKVNGQMVWDLEYLFKQILIGMGMCRRVGKIPVSVGIDTWGVDFVLLDNKDKLIGPAVAYRDSRTEGMDKIVRAFISEEDLYRRTGIQKQVFNTIYQLTAIMNGHRENLQQAKTILMLPDYFHFLLCGKKFSEYTNATTTQFVNAKTRDWDMDLIDILGFPNSIFQEILPPGTDLGCLREEIQHEVGYYCRVVLPPTHDTASAVVAVPSNEPTIYLNSGTWSLMGVEIMEPNLSKKSMDNNFTNEGGYENRYRYLKNIMGLWLVQEVRREVAPSDTYTKLWEGTENEVISSVIDCGDPRFFAPDSMVTEIQNYCIETGQEVPIQTSELIAVIGNSLALCYKETIGQIETMTGKTFGLVNVVGGGARAEQLNGLLAKCSGKRVVAGPMEATAMGNVIVQMISCGDLGNLEEARDCLLKSVDTQIYKD